MASNIPNDNITLPASWRGIAPVLVAVGAICVLISLGLFYFTGSEDEAGKSYSAFFHSYLANYMFCLSICLGALFFVMVQHLVRAGWSAAVRRLAELLAHTIPYWALLFLPILAMVVFTNSGALYEWNKGATNIESEVIRSKLSYLNPGFFTIRAIVYFAVFFINFLNGAVYIQKAFFLT